MPKSEIKQVPRDTNKISGLGYLLSVADTLILKYR